MDAGEGVAEVLHPRVVLPNARILLGRDIEEHIGALGPGEDLAGP